MLLWAAQAGGDQAMLPAVSRNPLPNLLFFSGTVAAADAVTPAWRLVLT